MSNSGGRCDSATNLQENFEAPNVDQSAAAPCEFQSEKGKGDCDLGDEKYVKVLCTFNKLKRIIDENRREVVREKLAANSKKLLESSNVRRQLTQRGGEVTLNSTVKKIYRAFSAFQSSSESEISEDLNKSMTILPKAHNVPQCYSTWIPTERSNLRFPKQSPENQRIDYDRTKRESIPASDSEDDHQSRNDDFLRRKEAKLGHELSGNEEFVIWIAVLEYGMSDELFEIISTLIGIEPKKLKETYDSIVADDMLFLSLMQILKTKYQPLDDTEVCNRVGNSPLQNMDDSDYLQEVYLEIRRWKKDRLSKTKHFIRTICVMESKRLQ